MMDFDKLWDSLQQEQCTLPEVGNSIKAGTTKRQQRILKQNKQRNLSAEKCKAATRTSLKSNIPDDALPSSRVDIATSGDSAAGANDLSFNASYLLTFEGAEAPKSVQRAEGSSSSFNSSSSSTFFVPGINGTARCLEGCQLANQGTAIDDDMKTSTSRRINLLSDQATKNSQSERRPIRRSISPYASGQRFTTRRRPFAGYGMNSSSASANSLLRDPRDQGGSERSLFDQSVCNDNNLAERRRRQTRDKLNEMKQMNKDLLNEEQKLQRLEKQQRSLRQKQKKALRELRQISQI